MPIGTLINACAIILGSLLGLMLGNRFTDRYRSLVYHSIGLCVLVIGLDMALGFDNILILVFAMLAGALCGQFLALDDRLTRAGNMLKARLGSSDARFTDGFVTASLLFCIGSMAIIGHSRRPDHFAHQVHSGRLHLHPPGLHLRHWRAFFLCLHPDLSRGNHPAGRTGPESFHRADHHTSTGGLLIMGIGINLLELKTINVTNMLPSLVFAVLLTVFFSTAL